MFNAPCIENPGVHLLNEVLTDYLRFKNDHEERLTQTVTRVNHILSSWMASKAELEMKNRIDGALFNPLQSIGIGETTHSALVGDLVNPHGSHGQGSLFLNSFLEFLGIPEPAHGKWAITVEKGRVDILLRRIKPDSVVIVENKSNGAVDQPNQLYRYWHRMIHLAHPNLKDAPESFKRMFKIVYLTPAASKEPVGNSLERPAEWHSLSGLPERVPSELLRVVTFKELTTHWLTDSKARISRTNFRLTAFLQFYSEIWQ